MDSERDITKRFIDFLKERGYPENAIIRDYIIGQNYHADVAILSQKKNRPIQIFELKSRKNDRSIQSGITTLKKVRSILEDEHIPAYIIFSEEKSQYVEVIDLDNPQEIIIANGDSKKEYSIFDYQSHENKLIPRLTEMKIQEKKETIDTFQYVSTGLGVIVLILVVCLKFGCFKIDSTDLVLIAYSIGLFLAPFASKIKMLGIEFERLSKDKESVA